MAIRTIADLIKRLEILPPDLPIEFNIGGEDVEIASIYSGAGDVFRDGVLISVGQGRLYVDLLPK